MTLLGIISDTHGLVRPEAIQALRGADLIIHAGDVGQPVVLERLREIAPVVAVRGNADTAPMQNWSVFRPQELKVRVCHRASGSCNSARCWPRSRAR
jgi:uncharacterized protein